MPQFRCPVCEQETIRARDKWLSNSFSTTTCPNCKSEIYASSRITALWRITQALLVTVIVLLSLLAGRPSMLLFAVLAIVVLEVLRVLLVPMVKLERTGGGFR